MPSRSTLCRRREREGQFCVRDMWLPEELLTVLVASDKLDPNMADNKQAVKAAVRRVLLELSAADVYFE